jgi:hypothetical protein
MNLSIFFTFILATLAVANPGVKVDMNSVRQDETDKVSVSYINLLSLDDLLKEWDLTC